MSADGKIAGDDKKQVRISSDEDIARVRDLRRRYDAILVGVGTVIADDPHLTVKGASFTENPLRVIVDPHGRTPGNAQAADGRAPTVILISDECDAKWNNVTAIRCGDPFDLKKAMTELYKMDVESVLVEGGGETISSFFRNGLVDKYTVFVGGMIIGGRGSPTPAGGDGWVCEGGLRMKMKSAEILGDGVLITYDVR